MLQRLQEENVEWELTQVDQTWGRERDQAYEVEMHYLLVEIYDVAGEPLCLILPVPDDS